MIRPLLLLFALCFCAVTCADVVMVLRAESNPDTTAPTVVSVAVNGFTWTVTYDEAVSGQTGFTAFGSTTGAIVLTGSGGNGTAVHTFAGDETAVNAETLTYDYTPGLATDAAGNPLAAIDDGEVTNNTPTPGDTTPPTLDTRTLAANGTSYTFVFSENVTGTGGFTVNASIQGAVTLTYVSGNGTNTHVYSGSPTVTDDETTTVSYTQGTLQDAAGNLLANVSAASVTNDSTVAAGDAPVLAHPEVIWVAAEGSLDFTPTTLQGSSITYTSDDKPAWVSINSSTGQLTGTAPASGEKATLTITATNSGGVFTTYATIHVYTSTANVSSADKGVDGTIELDTAWRKYTLTENITFDGEGFRPTAIGVGLDLAGFDVIYDNLVDTDIAITNGDFETGDATGWTLDSGVTVAAGLYLEAEVVEEANGYSLLFTVPAGQTLTATTTGNVTLAIGETYCFTGLVKQSGASVTTTFSVGDQSQVLLSARSGNVDVEDFTASQNETAPLIISVANAAAVTRTVRVDLVSVSRYGRHGLSPDFGNADSFTCDGGGGSVVQGAAGYPDCSPAQVQSVDDCTLQDMTLECRGVAGRFGSPIHSQYGVNKHFQNLTINNNIRYIANRDQHYGASLYAINSTSQGNVAIINNIFNGGPHIGIRVHPSDNGDLDIAYNSIYLKSRYTNGFAITCRLGSADGGMDNYIRHNTIDSTLTDDHACRGIHFDSADDIEVYGNTIRIQETPFNQEYKGIVLGGPYGIQMEGACKNLHVHDNHVTAVNNDGSGAYPLRLKLTATAMNNIVEDNTFRQEADGTVIPSGATDTIPGAGLNFKAPYYPTLRNNLFQCAEQYVFFESLTNSVSGWRPSGNTWERISGSGGGYANFYKQSGSTPGAIDMKWVDNAYASSTEESEWEAMSVKARVGAPQNQAGAPDTNDTIQLAWSITVHVTDGGVDQEGLTVDVYEAGSIVSPLTGTTDADGNATIVLDEYRYASGVMGSAMAFDIQVEAVEVQADYTPTEAETLEIAL